MTGSTSSTIPRPAAAAASQPAPDPARPRRARSRRWLRFALPCAVVAALLTTTAVAYTLQEPDQSDPAFLSPVSTSPIGGQRLADRLVARSIRVERETRASAALVSAYRGEATLFVPAPDLVHPYYLRMLKLMPRTTRVVMVRPSGDALARAHLPIGVDSQRLAAAVTRPDCEPVAAAESVAGAGPAALQRSRFTGIDPLSLHAHERYRCFAGSLVSFGWHATALTLAGATDPFRNDRIDEHHNAEVALALLSGAPRVVWLDLHRPEPAPGYLNDPNGGPPAPASLGPGSPGVNSPDPDFPVPAGSIPAGPARPGQPQPGEPQSDSGGGRSLIAVFPTVGWIVVLLALLTGLLLALAHGRRLGSPVTEPLPVTVPATETVTGRGRMYARSADRAAAMSILRVEARARLVRLLDLPPDVSQPQLVAAAAAQARVDPQHVQDALYGPSPADDKELVEAAAELDALLHAATDPPQPAATPQYAGTPHHADHKETTSE